MVKMKKQFGFAVVAALLAILLAFSAAAKSGSSDFEVKAGVTPDSSLHVFDRLFDRIGLALAFDNEAKAGKALTIAEERLAETEEMIAANKLDAAGIAQAGHGNALEVARQAIRGVSSGESEASLQAQVKFEAEIEKHEMRINHVRDGLRVKLELKDDVPESQLSLIDSLMSLLQNQTGEVKAEIKGEKDKLKLKIKSEDGRSEMELEAEIRGFEERAGLIELRMERAAEQIDEALEEIAEARALMNQTNLTSPAVSELLSQAELKVAAARAAFNESKFGEAFGLAQSAEQLAKNAKRQLERSISARTNTGRNGFGGDERLEIKAEVFNTTSEAKVELRFTAASTNRTEVIGALLSRLNLTREDINLLLDLENETVPDANDRLRTEIRTKEGLAAVRFELEFPLNTTNRSDIVEGIFSRLSSLTQESLERSLGAEVRVEIGRNDEREIEIEIEDGIAKVKVEVGRERLRFSMPFTDESAVFSEIAFRTGISAADVQALAEIKFEDDDNDDGDRRRGRGRGDDDENDNELEIRGRDDEAGDARGNADENEVRGRDAENEADDDDNRRGSGSGDGGNRNSKGSGSSGSSGDSGSGGSGSGRGRG